MKILIIGAKGQLGTDCCQLLGKAHTTLGCDIPSLDIGDAAAVYSYITAERPEVIINCAAYTAVDACEKEIELCWRVNAEGPKNLALAARKTQSRLIHISTDYVFDGKKPVPTAYEETDATNPLSEYGKSKLAGEQAVLELLEGSLILRTAWLYSAYGKNFLKTMLRLSLMAPDQERKVVHDQFGSLTWSYTLAMQIQRLLETDLTGIIHTTADGYSSWYEAACYFVNAMGLPHRFVPCTTAEYPTPAHRPANSILANARLNEKGLSCFVSWQEDVDRFVAAHKSMLLNEAKALIPG